MVDLSDTELTDKESEDSNASALKKIPSGQNSSKKSSSSDGSDEDNSRSSVSSKSKSQGTAVSSQTSTQRTDASSRSKSSRSSSSSSESDSEKSNVETAASSQNFTQHSNVSSKSKNLRSNRSSSESKSKKSNVATVISHTNTQHTNGSSMSLKTSSSSCESDSENSNVIKRQKKKSGNHSDDSSRHSSDNSVKRKKRKAVSRIKDSSNEGSSSDDEVQKKKTVNQDSKKGSDSSDDESSRSKKIPKRKHVSQLSKTSDSSDDESRSSKGIQKKKLASQDSKKSSDSSDDESYKEKTVSHDSKKDENSSDEDRTSDKNKTDKPIQKTKKSLLNDSDFETDKEDEIQPAVKNSSDDESSTGDQIRPKKSTVNGLNEFDETENIPLEVFDEDSQNARFFPEDTKEKKRKKKDADSKDQKLKIHSETQRLMREREISLPYHRPKQRSLREFLSRKKNTLTDIPLSSSEKRMKEVWKGIEDSTQSAFEFFKSESEEEDEIKKDEAVIQTTNNEEANNPDANFTDSKCIVNEQSSTDQVSKNDNKINETVKEPSAEDSGFETNQKAVTEVPQDNEISNETKNIEDESVTNNVPTHINENGENSLEIGNVNTESEVKESVDQSNSDLEISINKTSNWLKDVLAYENQQKKKENLLKKINPKLLSITPKLSGDSDSFIDLANEDSELQDGAKKLMDRFIKNCVAPKKTLMKREIDLTISTDERNEKGEISQLHTEKITYRLNDDVVLDDAESEKPGAKLQRLRMELQRKMEEKWEEEYKKRQAEMNVKGEKSKKGDEIEEEWEEEEIEESEPETETEPEEDDVEIVDKKREKSKYIDSEAEESGDEAEDEMDDEDEDEDEEENENDGNDEEEKNEDSNPGKDKVQNVEDDIECSLVPAYQPGGGLLNGGSNLTQRDENPKLPENLLSPSLNAFTISPSFKTPSTHKVGTNINTPDSAVDDISSHRRKLFADSNESDKFDLNDAFEFCSGRFPEAEEKDSISITQNDSISKISALLGRESEEYNVDDLISGKYGTQKTIPSNADKELADGWVESATPQTNTKKRIKVLEDDFHDSDEEISLPLDDSPEISPKRIASDDEEEPVVCNKKSKKILNFSDDEGEERKEESENEEEEDAEAGEEDEGSEVDEEEQQPDGEVDYDSEENEVVINPNDFIENEAELSESEWSGDEDEKGLDMLDIEAGDEDQIDGDQVRSQLEKIHMRRVLDDDKREVRYLQELFFEDGDLYADGKGRDRKFKWKNLGAFTNDDNREHESGDESQDDGEQEEELRKLRHEKTLFLMEMKKKGELNSDDEENDENSLLKLGRTVLEKSTKVSVVFSSKTTAEESVHPATKPFLLLNKRGSFLSRSEEYLSKIAKYTASTSDNINGPKHSRNFVFAVKSPEKEKLQPVSDKGLKRKMADDCNSSLRKKKKNLTGNDGVKRGPSLLDQLA